MIKTAVACLLFAVAVMRAEDWPQFRGRDRDGVLHEKGLAESFPADGLKVRWRTPVGWGWSSPVILGGRVFVTDSERRQPAAKERVLCFAEKTGEPLWTFSYDVNYPEFAFVPGQGGGPCGTPVVEEDRIYVTGSSGEVHCLETTSGLVIWRRKLGEAYQVNALECRSSPLIEGGLLIVVAWGRPGATVVALDKTSGKEVWKALDEGRANSSPLVVTAGGARQLIIWTGDSVTSLNPATGATYWREPLVTSSNDSIPTPVVQGNRLLISGLMLELDVEKPAARVVWPERLTGTGRILSRTSSPVLQGGHVYSARSSGELVCLDAATGQQIWGARTVTRLRNGSSIHLTPCSDAMFLFSDAGDLIRARLTPQGYHEISRAHLLEPTTPFGAGKCAWTPPAYAHGHVYARNDEELVCASLTAAP